MFMKCYAKYDQIQAAEKIFLSLPPTNYGLDAAGAHPETAIFFRYHYMMEGKPYSSLVKLNNIAGNQHR